MGQSTITTTSTVLICCVWYALSSFTSQMTKVVLTKMPYPFLLAQIQFTISGILSFCLIHLFCILPQIHKVFPPGTVPLDPSTPLFRKTAFFKILPLGVLQSSGKYVSLCATQIVPVATVASIKALSPLLIIVGYRIFYNVKLPALTYLSLMPLLGGVIMIILEDASDATAGPISGLFSSHIDTTHLKGILYCVIGVLIMATQQIYGKELITWDQTTSESPAMFVLNPKPNDSGPTTPSGQEVPRGSPIIGKTTNSGFFSMSPKTIAQKFTHRTSDTRLPYSVSDLNLNKLDPHSSKNAYALKAEEARLSTNPFTYFTSTTGTVKPDKLTVIFYISLIGVCTSSVGVLSKEAHGLLQVINDPSLYQGSVESGSEALMVFFMIILISLCHFAQTLISFLLLGSIPALSYSIASMMKRIVIIVVSILVTGKSEESEESEGKWFGRVTTHQVLGLSLIGAGMYSYDKWGSKSTKRPHSLNGNRT